MKSVQTFEKEFWSPRWAYVAFSAIFLAVAFIFLPIGGHEHDQACWSLWSVFILENGLSRVYESGTDYLPLYHYILTVFGWILGSPEKISANIHFVKMISLGFHCISGYFLLQLLLPYFSDWRKAFGATLFFLFNIAVLYNSFIWGQVDGIMTSLVFVSFYCAYKKYVKRALIFLVLAVNFKLQAIVFTPLIGLMLLPVLATGKFRLANLSVKLLAPVTVQIALLLPFIISGSLSSVWNVVTGSFGHYPTVSVNAFNIWFLFLKGDPRQISDTGLLFGLNYNQWGLLGFFSFSFFALYPLLKHTYKSIIGKVQQSVPLNYLLAVGALIPLLFFYLNTQMHERYSHPALIFLVAFCILTRSPILGITGCAAYFLNLEAILQAMHFDNYHTLIFEPRFISILFLITIITLFVKMYRIVLTPVSTQNELKS